MRENLALIALVINCVTLGVQLVTLRNIIATDKRLKEMEKRLAESRRNLDVKVNMPTCVEADEAAARIVAAVRNRVSGR